MALVLFEKNVDTLRISLNRASALNAIDSALLQELERGLKEYREDEGLKAVAVFGQGGCFAAGADIYRIEPPVREALEGIYAAISPT